ncbi:MAG: hypothetical protein EHM61_14970 [Acidobacteria bacterium]|nr:MAG: hypothetical protein EHM61_14970 [Acidobacteriota bacterium]
MEAKKNCWCGLEVGEQAVRLCLLSESRDSEQRAFGNDPAEHQALADWLSAHGCTHIALNPVHPGWKPLSSILKKRFAVKIIEDRTITQSRAGQGECRCEWLAELLRTGQLDKLDQVEPIGDRTPHTDEDALGGQPGKGPEHSGEKGGR